ncbi:protein MTSS 1-like [Chanos chanos]|uniref:Protein MTSS 1-like n=1 Tax=Chanos chanos TaxID=29144 RepID=A0A6J2WP26_CHACN|nr:protein MTSS 1 [Chanos chanos]
METVMEREISALGGLFQTVMSDMKCSYPVWEDFISKAGKLQSQLRSTVMAVASFLDAFQKVADLATGSRGGTRDIGSALTRMCMRQRSIEAKIRQFSLVFVDSLINPLEGQIEEWKRAANTLDKDHAREYKKARQEIKRRSSDTLKLQKKAKKGRGDLQPQVDNVKQDMSERYQLLEEGERQAVRRALIEERARFCSFVSMLRPVLEEEVSMLGELTHLQTISADLRILTMDPHTLPPASEQVIMDLKGSDYSWSHQTPPSSPSTSVSRKSSLCSSLNSVNSSDSRSSGSHSHSPTSHYGYRGSAQPQQGPTRLSSVSSHDSGFISQDACQSISASPMPPESSPQDWTRPGPYDQPVLNTLWKKKEKREGPDPGTTPGPERPSPTDETQRPRTTKNPNISVQAHEELALVLSRGLQLDLQHSPGESLQGSSGYNTHTHTPCCPEDMSPSQVSDCEYFSVGGTREEQQAFDRFSVISRSGDISLTNHRVFQSKRTVTPPSSAGPVIITPGVATIRRTPSSKPGPRRPPTGGPIPIRTPVVPVKTPTVPGMPIRASVTAKGEGPQPITTEPEKNAQSVTEGAELAAAEGDDMLSAIRRGVKLKRTTTNDRSAPHVH